MINFEAMQSEKIRIQQSIFKIKSLEQVQSTHEWINLFEKKFKATDVAEGLKLQLRQVEL